VTLARPAAEVTIDGRALTLAEAAVARCHVETSVLGRHDRATLVLGSLSPLLDTAPGATAEISIGLSDDALETVITGSVDRVGQLPWGACLDIASVSADLDRARVGRSYVQQSMGDIVRDLLSEAGVDEGQIDDGPMIAVYNVDERRSAWHHLRSLAALYGAELSSGGDGGVNLRPPRTGRADHTLRAGAELLGWIAGERTPGTEPLASSAFSAASEQGSDAWSLIRHEASGGDIHDVLPTVRDQDSASARDQALSAAHDRSGGFAKAGTTGIAKLRAGDLVELDGVDRAAGTYRALAVDHRVDSGGFVSLLTLEAAA
jgi:phage protein D